MTTMPRCFVATLFLLLALLLQGTTAQQQDVSSSGGPAAAVVPFELPPQCSQGDYDYPIEFMGPQRTIAAGKYSFLVFRHRPAAERAYRYSWQG
jgi:hypothetical protein